MLPNVPDYCLSWEKSGGWPEPVCRYALLRIMSRVLWRRQFTFPSKNCLFYGSSHTQKNTAVKEKLFKETGNCWHPTVQFIQYVDTVATFRTPNVLFIGHILPAYVGLTRQRRRITGTNIFPVLVHVYVDIQPWLALCTTGRDGELYLGAAELEQEVPRVNRI
jgi:hypothetical protein